MARRRANLMRSKTTCLLLLGLSLSLTSWAGPAVAQESGGNKTLARPLSPSVLGTFFFRGNQIDLLVLWRGAPGWLLGSERMTTSGTSSSRTLFLTYGPVHLDITFDRAQRIATIDGRQLTLPEPKNTVLVDGVGTGKLTVSTIAADLSVDSANPLVADILKRSPEVVAFLRCDGAVAHPIQRLGPNICDDLKSN